MKIERFVDNFEYSTLLEQNWLKCNGKDIFHYVFAFNYFLFKYDYDKQNSKENKFDKIAIPVNGQV